LFIIFKKYNFKKVIQASIIFFFTFAICFFSIIAIAKFPYPKTEADFSASSLFSQRAKQFSSESAVSSRWNLLPEVLLKIKNNFFVGGGFGSTVTYKSSDPRVLESTADGLFTTYAFEWGWLDVWLKLGLLGLIAYLFLLFRLFFKKNTSNGNDIVNGLNLGILILVLVSVFSPYLNHPLGIGYLIFVTLWFNNDEKNNTLAIK
jgi:O-antigen ligase